jgi:solute carrier family 25 (adenine nucleotide translocator) protein 4/5/6/31
MAFKEFFRRFTVNEAEKSRNYTQFVMGNLLAGGLSGCATFCVIYPLDFSRTRLAIDMGKDTASREFRGLTDCLIKIARHDGFIGLYRGFLPSLQFIFIYRATYYGLFDVSKAWTADRDYTKNDLSFLLAFGIGLITTLIASMTSYPLDTIRRRLMMDAGKTHYAYSGTIDCAKVFKH